MLEIRCHVCGAVLDGCPMEHQMGSSLPFQETCSQECFDVYYAEPEQAQASGEA